MAGVELLLRKETERARLWAHLGKFIVAARFNTCREVKGEGNSPTKTGSWNALTELFQTKAKASGYCTY